MLAGALGYMPLLVMLCVAAVVDLRSRRIPNALALALMLTGLMQSFTAFRTVGPGYSALGVLVGGMLLAPLMILGALGGGDVKLLAAAGAWLGPWLVFQVFLAAEVAGMLLVVGQCMMQGRLRTLLQNSVLLVVNLAHVREVGVEHTRATGAACRSADKPLPFAVPVLIAVTALLMRGGLP